MSYLWQQMHSEYYMDSYRFLFPESEKQASHSCLFCIIPMKTYSLGISRNIQLTVYAHKFILLHFETIVR